MVIMVIIIIVIIIIMVIMVIMAIIIIIINNKRCPPFLKMSCKQILEVRYALAGPSTLVAKHPGCWKTRLHTPEAVAYHEQSAIINHYKSYRIGHTYCRFMLGHCLVRMESRIKKFTPHCIQYIFSQKGLFNEMGQANIS